MFVPNVAITILEWFSLRHCVKTVESKKPQQLVIEEYQHRITSCVIASIHSCGCGCGGVMTAAVVSVISGWPAADSANNDTPTAAAQ